MKIDTRLFGPLEWDESNIIRMPEGLLGFNDKRSFVLIEDERVDPFRWLQSADCPELALAVIDPLIFRPNYEIPLSAESAELIGYESGHNALILAISVLSRDPRHITVNLAGPLVINAQTMTGLQVILDSSQLSTRHPAYNDLLSAARHSGAVRRSSCALQISA